jgi:hypothetical protein
MLSDETHARLRRIARRRRVPLAVVIREALADLAEAETRRPLSFIGAFDGDAGDFTAASTAEMLPPLTPFRSAPLTPEEVEHFRRLADKRAGETDR